MAPGSRSDRFGWRHCPLNLVTFAAVNVEKGRQQSQIAGDQDVEIELIESHSRLDVSSAKASQEGVC